MADICLASQAAGAKFFNVDTAPFPNFSRIVDELSKIDAFARAHPLKQPGAPAAPLNDPPPLEEMMQRAAARADAQPVRRGNGGADISLGLAHRFAEQKALGKASGDRRGQRAAGAVAVLRFGRAAR